MWRGEGEGHYPTISTFDFGEELTFAHPNPAKARAATCCCGAVACVAPDGCGLLRLQPVVSYSHKTWRVADKTPMHAECGFLRPKPDGSADFACAQATGLAEASSGTWDAATRTLLLATTSVGNAAKVLEITRRYTLSADGGELSYSISMRTHEQSLKEHLCATLKRV